MLKTMLCQVVTIQFLDDLYRGNRITIERDPTSLPSEATPASDKKSALITLTLTLTTTLSKKGSMKSYACQLTFDPRKVLASVPENQVESEWLLRVWQEFIDAKQPTGFVPCHHCSFLAPLTTSEFRANLCATTLSLRLSSTLSERVLLPKYGVIYACNTARCSG